MGNPHCTCKGGLARESQPIEEGSIALVAYGIRDGMGLLSKEVDTLRSLLQEIRNDPGLLFEEVDIPALIAHGMG